MIIRIEFYTKNSGKSPVLDFLNKLPTNDRARVFACLKSIEELGFDTPRVTFRQIRGNLWEIKIRLRSNDIRVFYVCLNNGLLVLLHAYKKKSQKAPKVEINLAEKRLLEVFDDEANYT